MERLQATPLSTEFQHIETIGVSAYHQCRVAEADITSQVTVAEKPNDKELQRNRVCIRILGCLLSHGPTIQVIREVAQAVMSCHGETERMVNLGGLYYIRLFIRQKDPTPQPSCPLSRPSFDYTQQEVVERLVASPRDHRVGKELALVRDNYRCQVTGAVDDEYFTNAPEWPREQSISQGLSVYPADCCHIFPESANMNFDEGDEAGYAAGVWNVLRRWGEGSLEAEIAGDAIHSLRNILTLSSYVHYSFDKLKIWFEETATPHHYHIGASDPTASFLLQKIPRKVTFQSAHSALELPSPRLLRLHAACCKVAWLSGAAHYIGQLEKDSNDYDPYGPVPADTLAALLSDVATLPTLDA